MVTKPVFRIEVGGEDKTQQIQKNLTSIQVTDQTGDATDELRINVFGDFEPPAYGDSIRFWLDKVLMGNFYVQSCELKPGSMSVHATAVHFGGSTKEKRSKTWGEISMKQICSAIAERNSLKMLCDVDHIYFGSISQKEESDISFLRRIAKIYNCYFNIKNNTLIFTQSNQKKTTYSISIQDCEDYSFKLTNREKYNSCQVNWRDTITNSDVQTKHQTEKPVLMVKTSSVRTENEALNLAKEKLKQANQGQTEGNVKITGRVWFAGNKLNITDAKTKEKIFQINKVEQNITPSNWSTTADFYPLSTQ